MVGYNSRSTFVHNAGNGGLLGRNGTVTLIEAWRQVKSPARLLLRAQKNPNIPVSSLNSLSSHRIDYVYGTVPYAELWREGGQGDVFVWPHKFDGLSLPLQESFASGMAVMGVDRNPDNTWLPTEPLIPVQNYRECSVAHSCTIFQEAVIDPSQLASHIDSWYGKDISHLSDLGREWAEKNSWTNSRQTWIEALLTLHSLRSI